MCLSVFCHHQGHLLPVANLALHPSKPILATASDDKTWKLWHLPHGDLIMCGEGHKDWVAGVDFHPAGTSLASGSGQQLSACAPVGMGGNQPLLWPCVAVDAWRLTLCLCMDAACRAGDSTVKVWSFEKQRCVATLSDHKQAVWSVKYHDQGDWLASCSLDHSVRWGEEQPVVRQWAFGFSGCS